MHAERLKYLALNGSVVGGTEFVIRVQRVAADKARSCGHQIGVLEKLAEFAARLHCRQLLDHRFWTRTFAVEQPFQILTRHAGAGAYQMFNQHLARRIGIAELEAWQQLGDWSSPFKLPLVTQAREHQRRQCLRVGSDHEQCIGIDRSQLPQFAHTEAASEYDLAVIYKAN